MTMRKLFNQQKSNAKRRGIAWQLTFEQWSQIWLDSGKWELRGRNSGQYCMSRYGDLGPYAVDNVRIVTVNINGNEMTYQHTEAAKLKIGAFHKGKQYLLGKKLSEIHKHNISQGNKGRIGGFVGKRHSEETKEIKRKTWRNQYGSADQ
jgi:hypothetical protein